MYGNPNTTISWDTTTQIIFAAIFVCVFLFVVILLLVNRYAAEQLRKMNYKNVLKCRRILLAFNINPKIVWMVHLMLAVASYETGNEADFIKYINLIKERKAQPAVLYRKAIYMFFKGQDDFFERYFVSYKAAEKRAEELGITLRSSSSHLLNYSKRERFCYNLLCLTPYGTLTMCPDVSSPNEKDYKDSLIGELSEGNVAFDEKAFARLSHGSIHTIDKCKVCYARWNCGSGCPSSRRVYDPEIFDAICGHYRKMLCHSLVMELAQKHHKATGRDLFEDIKSKL
jgi:radical SAM protein with 4Fe4S-binding SPASM domain